MRHAVFPPVLMSLRRQVGGYAVVGGLQWLLEYAVMLALSQWWLPVASANVIGRICGASLGFWLNGAWTFAGDGRGVSRRALLRFLVMWLLITAANTALVHAIDARFGLRAAQLAKPAVDVACALIQFVLSRHWVYRQRPQ